MRDRPLKIVCYNILDGGLGRLDPIYETLLYLEGDLVGLCEAEDRRNPNNVRYLAEKLGMDFVTAESQSGRAVALLSRRPVRQMINMSLRCPILDRGAMEATVEVDGAPLRIALVHLEAGQRRQDEDLRLAQIRQVLAVLEESAVPTVLMGDLNAAAPYDPFDYDAASPKVKQRLAERAVRQLDHDVVQHIASRGWIDAYQRVRTTAAKHTYTTGFPAARFDYIWLSGGLERSLADADVERGGFAPYCSDHYPLWATIRFP
jgi:endonuclease/exonuclease/phosphatase family metal-dependent hydrolase